MSAEIRRKLFTVHDFHHMAEAGIIDENDRLELIAGEIVAMTPIGYRHWECVNRTTHVLIRKLDARAEVAPQGPARLDEMNEPQPDVAVFKAKRDFYNGEWPTPAEMLLVIEVADSSLAYDRGIKLSRYALAGIPEYWIEDLIHDALLVFRNPMADTYESVQTLHRGESVSPLAFPDVVIAVDDLIGESSPITRSS